MCANTSRATVVAAVFAHVRNLTTSSIILGAGVMASGREGWDSDATVPTFVGSHLAAIAVAVIGSLLVLLNLWDGIASIPIATGRWRLPMRIAVVLISVLTTFRIVQVLVLIRAN